MNCVSVFGFLDVRVCFLYLVSLRKKKENYKKKWSQFLCLSKTWQMHGILELDGTCVQMVKSILCI